MLLAPGEQLLGFRQAALANAQLGHGGAGRGAELRDVVPRVCRERALQRLLGLRPAALGQEHVRVDRAARAEERRGRVRAREVLDQLAPLRRELPLAGVHAGRDQVAVRLAERVHVVDAPHRGRRHRLLEQPHAVFLAPRGDVRPAEQAEREHLQVGRIDLPRDRHRSLGVLDALLHALRVAGALDRDPAVPGAAADALERALGARQPAARSRGAPEQVVLVRDPDGGASGSVAVAFGHVLLERALALGDRLVHAAEEPERLPAAVVRRGRLADRERRLEPIARRLPLRGVERRLCCHGGARRARPRL